MTGTEALADNKRIRSLRVIVETAGTLTPKYSGNHWSLYLVISENSSVRLNIAGTGPGDRKDTLCWFKLNYIKSFSELAHGEVFPTLPLRVMDVAKLVYD